MGAFDHVLVLLSFVYALALTHVLSRIAALFMARDKVKPYGPLALAMANAVLIVSLDWLALWPFRGVTSWDLASIADELLLSIALFFMCAVVAPEMSEAPVDLEAYYGRVRVPFYGLFALSNILTMLGNLDFLKTSDPSRFASWTIGATVFFVPPVLALAVRARWAQWTAGVTLAILVVLSGITLQGNFD
jgi:hypothetical protein